MDISLFGLATWTLSWWKAVGLLGALCFGARWLVQAFYRSRTGSSRIPTSFWVLSVVGALMQTLYFIFGKNDSVGIISTSLPLGVAVFNLWKDLRSPRPTAAS